MEAIRSWIADAFKRENEALTKALQISLSDDTSALPPPPPPATSPESSGPPANRTGTGRTGHPVPCFPAQKIAKRRPRGSNRSATTYINADPADFRRMVQEVTGASEKRAGPEPDRTGMSRVGLLVDRTVGPVPDGPVFEFEPFPCFPTLESWGM